VKRYLAMNRYIGVDSYRKEEKIIQPTVKRTSSFINVKRFSAEEWRRQNERTAISQREITQPNNLKKKLKST
jgi:hypothetical protein